MQTKGSTFSGSMKQNLNTLSMILIITVTIKVVISKLVINILLIIQELFMMVKGPRVINKSLTWFAQLGLVARNTGP